MVAHACRPEPGIASQIYQFIEFKTFHPARTLMFDIHAVRNAVGRTLEQWPDRGPDQSSQDVEVCDVRPRGHGAAQGQTDAD
jgi:hypothetical protein